jgi:hypothetical protein
LLKEEDLKQLYDIVRRDLMKRLTAFVLIVVALAPWFSAYGAHPAR